MRYLRYDKTYSGDTRLKSPGKQDKKKPHKDFVGFYLFLAETKGFEPLIRLPVYAISSRAHSTTLPRLRRSVIIQISFLFASVKHQNYNPGPI